MKSPESRVLATLKFQIPSSKFQEQDSLEFYVLGFVFWVRSPVHYSPFTIHDSCLKSSLRESSIRLRQRRTSGYGGQAFQVPGSTVVESRITNHGLSFLTVIVSILTYFQGRIASSLCRLMREGGFHLCFNRFRLIF